VFSWCVAGQQGEQVKLVLCLQLLCSFCKEGGGQLHVDMSATTRVAMSTRGEPVTHGRVNMDGSRWKGLSCLAARLLSWLYTTLHNWTQLLDCTLPQVVVCMLCIAHASKCLQQDCFLSLSPLHSLSPPSMLNTGACRALVCRSKRAAAACGQPATGPPLPRGLAN